MRSILVVVSISAVLFSACATGGTGKNSVTITGAQILDSGAYEGNLLERKNTTNSHGKMNTYEDVEFVSDSNRIPAVIGNRFGIRIVLRGEPDDKKVKVKILRHHPPMNNPHKNKVISLSEYTRELSLNSPHLIGYGFDEDWELVEGEHLFEVLYDDQKLIEQSFTVYKP